MSIIVHVHAERTPENPRSASNTPEPDPITVEASDYAEALTQALSTIPTGFRTTSIRVERD